MREPKSRDEHITGPTLFISGRQMDKMPVSCTSTSDTGSEEMLPGKWIPVQYYADGEWYGCFSPVWYFMFNDNGTGYEYQEGEETPFSYIYNSSRRNLTIYGTVYEGSWTVESLSSGELTISTDDLDFADYGETKIRMTRD